MKLASYQDGSRDGQLIVVSRDLSSAHYATDIATRLQQVLDDWNFMSPQLEALSQALNQGKARHAFAFDPRRCLAPLPRAHAWAQAWAPTPAALAAAQSAAPAAAAQPAAPVTLRCDRADAFIGPHGPVRWPVPAAGRHAAAPAHLAAPAARALHARPQLLALGADLGAGLGADALVDGVRLLTLACGLTVGAAARADVAGAMHPEGLPADALDSDDADLLGVAMAPVAVTPDELGSAWSKGRASLQLTLQQTGRSPQRADTAETPWHVGQLLARWTRHRSLRSGWALGLGTPAGWSPTRVEPGHTVQLSASDRDGHAVFGRIELTLPDAQAEAD